MDRVLALSDGVFAFALTLLAVDIRLPSGLPQDVSGPELAAAILSLLPSALAYAQTFLLVGVYWLAHKRMFTYIRRQDRGLLWLNLLFLLFVAFLPVPSSTLGRYGLQRPVAVFYATSLVLTGLADLSLWLYASHRHRLVNRDLDPDIVRYYALRGLVPVLVFALSIPVALLEPAAVAYLWLALLVVERLLGHLYQSLQRH